MSAKDQADQKYQTSGNYIHRKIADTDVLISIGANIANFNGYIQLNESAAALWERLAKPSTRAELERFLEEKYGIPQEQAVQDVTDFLEELGSHDMVTVQ